jgi:hypothetical protein
VKGPYKKAQTTLRRARKKVSIATIVLMLATFFNPFGFDALFALTMKLTGSYWITDAIFYCLSASFFGLYFYLRKREQETVNK